MLPEELPPALKVPSAEAPSLGSRPSLNSKQRDHAHRLAAEYIAVDDEAFITTESPALRRWFKYATGGSYKPPCDDTIKAHLTMVAADGRVGSTEFNAELIADGISPSHAADLWSDSGVALYGASTHGILRKSVLVDPSMLPKVSGPWQNALH